jgi:hypothetical protein
VTETTIERVADDVKGRVKGRVLRGLALYRARGEEIVARPAGGYSVPSATHEDRTYRVCLVSGRCGCEDSLRGRRTRSACLHVYAATLAEAKGRKA